MTEDTRGLKEDLLGLEPKAIEIGKRLLDAARQLASGQAATVELPVTLFGVHMVIELRLKQTV